MKITILCSSRKHPVNAYLEKWICNVNSKHTVELVRSKNDLASGDILFLISSGEIIDSDTRSNYAKTLVIHASYLPLGRGWSPHIWQILEGSTEISVSLLEAEDGVDSGDLWEKLTVHIFSGALWSEINHIIFEAELKLMNIAIEQFKVMVPKPQSDLKSATYYPRRTPRDSKLDPKMSIEDQFNLMRASDPDRFPAYFDMHGERYIIRLEKQK